MKHRCNVILSAVRLEPRQESEMLTQILYGETCEKLESSGSFSKIKMDFDGAEGWMDNRHLSAEDPVISKDILAKPYGIYDLPEGRSLLSMGSEAENIFDDVQKLSFAETAEKFLNVPYLHGGRSFFGTDFAGFLQISAKVCGIRLPRTAELMASCGRVLDFIHEAEAGDLAFFENEEGRIYHVGMVARSGDILHCDEKVRIDSLDSAGIFNKNLKKHTHRLRFIRRILEI